MKLSTNELAKFKLGLNTLQIGRVRRGGAMHLFRKSAPGTFAVVAICGTKRNPTIPYPSFSFKYSDNIKETEEKYTEMAFELYPPCRKCMKQVGLQR